VTPFSFVLFFPFSFVFFFVVFEGLYIVIPAQHGSDSSRTSKLTTTRLTGMDRSSSNFNAKQHPKRNREHQQMSASIREKYETLNPSTQMRSQTSKPSTAQIPQQNTFKMIQLRIRHI
jgi:hypothetical protein